MDYLFIHRADGGVSVCGLRPGAIPAEELVKWEEQVAGGTDAAAWLPIDGFSLHTDPTFPSRRFRNAWRHGNGSLAVSLVEARKVRQDELKAERDRLLKEAAELGPLAEAAGAVTTAYVASRNAKDLQALDDAAIQTSVDGVNDLTALETHEPAAIASAKSEVLPTSQELTAALRAEAKTYLATAANTQAKKDRAIVAILLDELNDLRAWVTSFKAATAAATSLNDLKTRVAALANTPARTMTQARTKYENMVDSGKQDDGMAD